MILSKIIAIILAFISLICHATWLTTQKQNRGFATIASVISFAIMVIVIKIANTLL